jgi:hypothetical protein
MESELWSLVYHLVVRLARGQRPRGAMYQDAEIVGVYLWAVLHDRPVLWACQRRNWPICWRRRPLPTPSTMSRRLRRPAVRRLLQEAERHLRPCCGSRWCQWIDAKPLPVGGASQDRHARAGRAVRGLARGYKLYAIGRAGGAFEAWMVLPMNVNERRAARHLLRQVEGVGYLVGDAEYDSNALFDLAATRGFQLVAPRIRPGALGHHYQSPRRLRSIDLLTRPFGQALRRQRYDIDRFFGRLGNFGGGLAPLPNWVRTYRRVRLWVHGKILINLAHLALKAGTAA